MVLPSVQVFLYLAHSFSPTTGLSFTFWTLTLHPRRLTSVDDIIRALFASQFKWRLSQWKALIGHWRVREKKFQDLLFMPSLPWEAFPGGSRFWIWQEFLRQELNTLLFSNEVIGLLLSLLFLLNFLLNKGLKLGKWQKQD